MLICYDCKRPISNGDIFYELEYGNYCNRCMLDRLRIAEYVKQASLDELFPDLQASLAKLTVYGGAKK